MSVTGDATRFDETRDFVVVGSGGGSMCAGLVMRDAGHSVLILEKTDRIGGTTARSGGVMWIPNNRYMARDGVPDSPEQAATYLDAVLGDAADAPGASPARRATYLREAPRMLDFLVAKGVRLTRVREWPDYYDELPGGSVPGRAVVAELFDDADELVADAADVVRVDAAVVPQVRAADAAAHHPHHRVCGLGEAGVGSLPDLDVAFAVEQCRFHGVRSSFLSAPSARSVPAAIMPVVRRLTIDMDLSLGNHDACRQY